MAPAPSVCFGPESRGFDQFGFYKTWAFYPEILSRSLFPLPATAFSRYREGMEVHFTPETEKRLGELATETGRGTAELVVQDLVEEYFEDLAHTRETVDRRYDDLESGRVKLISCNEVIQRLRAKSAAYRTECDERV